MKAFKTIMAVAVVTMFAFSSTAFAANGFGGQGRGGGQGMINGGQGGGFGGPGRDGGQEEGFNKPLIDILSGTPFTLTGTVISIQDRRGGMELDDGTDTYKVYGIGPIWFWESAGIAKPVVGDEITVSGYDVSFNDNLRKIAMSVIVAGNELQLRDAETGEPVWRGMERPNPFTEGEAAVIEGNVSNILTFGRGGGIEVDTGAETVAVCGIGPAEYWEDLGVDLPEVGDAIVVNGVKITLNDGSERMIASSIVINGQTVELHDAETGAPLFRGKRHNRPRFEDDSFEPGGPLSEELSVTE